MPNAPNSGRQEKKRTPPLIQKWQKRHLHIGDKGKADVWTRQRNVKMCQCDKGMANELYNLGCEI